MASLLFAYPPALYGAVLALPVVAFHLYRKRRRRVVVAFAPLLREAAAPVKSFGGFARVSEWIRLSLRLAALSALVLAAAGVQRAGLVPAAPRDLVLVLDGDVTQRTSEGDSGGTLVEQRFDRSVALAIAYIRAQTSGRTSLVFAGVVPRTVVAPTIDREAAVRALADLDPESGDADLEGAITVAKSIQTFDRSADPAATRSATRVVVVTARALPKNSTDVEVATAGSASSDLGFVDQAAAPLPDGVKTRARFVVRNFGMEAAKAHVRLQFRGDAKLLEERDLELEPVAEADVVIDVIPPKGGGVLEAAVSAAGGVRDAFAGNNVTAMALCAPARPSVLVVHRGSPRPFVRALLEALGDTVDRDASGYVDVEKLASATPRDLFIYDATGPEVGSPTSAAIYLAPFPKGPLLPFRSGRTLNEPLVWRASAEHPLLRGVDLSTAYVATATTIRGEGVVGLAFVEGEAVLAEGGAAGARFVALGLDPEGSDLPVRAALPILLKNAIRRLSIAPSAPLPPFVRAGAPIVARAAIGGPWSLEFEDISKAPIALRDFRRKKPASGGPDLSLVAPAGPFAADTMSPDAPGPPAPPGGPFLVTFRDPRSHELRVGTRTVCVDLDRRRVVRPAGPETPFPPPLPVQPEGDESWWARVLLAIAGGLLVLDAVLGALVRRRVARPVAAA